jgi:hypothetical protein
MQTLINQGGLAKDMIGNKLMTFGINGVFVSKVLGHGL